MNTEKQYQTLLKITLDNGSVPPSEVIRISAIFYPNGKIIADIQIADHHKQIDKVSTDVSPLFDQIKTLRQNENNELSIGSPERRIEYQELGKTRVIKILQTDSEGLAFIRRCLELIDPDQTELPGIL